MVDSKDENRDVTVQDAINPITPNLHLIPATEESALLEREISLHHPRVDLLFFYLFSPLRDRYDYTIFDCSPSLNKTNASIISVIDCVILPYVPYEYAYNGLFTTFKWIEQTFDLLKLDRDPKLNIFINRYTNSDNESLKHVRKACSYPLLRPFLF